MGLRLVVYNNNKIWKKTHFYIMSDIYTIWKKQMTHKKNIHTANQKFF